MICALTEYNVGTEVEADNSGKIEPSQGIGIHCEMTFPSGKKLIGE